MRLAIIKAGGPPAALADQWPSYPKMVRQAFGGAWRYEEFDATAGVLPAPDAEFSGVVITGSAASAYEGEPWIDRLTEWIKGADTTPVIGLCFGHQVMAEALGGKVELSTQGWLGGCDRYHVKHRAPWMSDASQFVLPVAHQDQVVRTPPNAQVLASSDFCPIAALAYGDRPAISFQAHPEFSVDYALALLSHYAGQGLVVGEEAIAARRRAAWVADTDLVRRWMETFLRQHASATLT